MWSIPPWVIIVLLLVVWLSVRSDDPPDSTA